MAGDWIKLRCDIDRDPAVISISATLGLDSDTVVGKLARLWTWAGQMSANGHINHVPLSWVDTFVGAQGFADHMVKVGWLEVENNTIVFPKWDRHNSENAKKRALDAERKRLSRSGQTSLNLRTKSGQVRDQRREEKRREELTTTSPNGDSVAKARASRRCPDGFDLTPDRQSFASERGLRNVAEEFAGFRDYEFKTGKTDWDAAWRNWVRRASKNTDASGPFAGNLTAGEKTIAASKRMLVRAAERQAEREARDAEGNT